jgi:hypothetical protein
MSHLHLDAPHPDLRIVPTEALHPHEEHDSQRAIPLAERLHTEAYMINPPVVAAMGDGYVVLDGANRFHAFSHLGYPHILVQVVAYVPQQVELKTWHHIVGGWSAAAFLEGVAGLDAKLNAGTAFMPPAPGAPPVPVPASALAKITLRDGEMHTLSGPAGNTLTRAFVGLYQRSAALHRTALNDKDALWTLYPDATALIEFAPLSPQAIMRAAETHDYLPPGVSRHIVHGRAIRVNYPLEHLRDRHTPLAAKNAALQEWVRARLAARKIRYYAEATYQYDE